MRFTRLVPLSIVEHRRFVLEAAQNRANCERDAIGQRVEKCGNRRHRADSPQGVALR
jgi:hypothetical protein